MPYAPLPTGRMGGTYLLDTSNRLPQMLYWTYRPPCVGTPFTWRPTSPELPPSIARIYRRPRTAAEGSSTPPSPSDLKGEKDGGSGGTVDSTTTTTPTTTTTTTPTKKKRKKEEKRWTEGGLGRRVVDRRRGRQVGRAEERLGTKKSRPWSVKMTFQNTWKA